MTISGNINIICNDDNTIKTIYLYDNNNVLTVELSESVALFEVVHNTKNNAHSNLFNVVNAKNDAQDLQISALTNNKADKSELPTVNNATLTITQGGTTKGTFTANASSNVTIDVDAGGSWGGITGTLSDQTDLQNAINNKMTTDASNASQTGKNTIIGWGTPDYSAGISLEDQTTNEQEFTMVSDGVLAFTFYNYGGSSNGYIYVNNSLVCQGYAMSGSMGNTFTGTVPVSKNDTVRYKTNSTGSGYCMLTFYPLKGAS